MGACSLPNNPPATYTVPKLQALYRQLEGRLHQLPGVQGTGLAMYNPLTNNWGELIFVAGHPAPKFDGDSGASWDRVSADYLENFGMTALRGRNFNNSDNENSQLVAIVNQAFVKRFFKSGEDPIDQHFGLDSPQDASTFRIIGVVRDAKFAGFALNRPARPMFYVPLAQNVDYADGDIMRRVELRSHFIGGIMLVTNATPGALEPILTRTLADLEPDLTLTSVRTMRQQVELQFDQERAVASLAGLFGIVALLLAAIGLYGVTAYTVAQRKNEIGIRMALGADRTHVIAMVLRGTSTRVLVGLLLGVPLSIGAGRLISAQLYGVVSWDPEALAVAAAIFSTACGVKVGLRPRPSATSQRQSDPSLMNRFRHTAAVLKLISKAVAMSLSGSPWAAAKTIWQRCETCCGVLCAATQRTNSNRSVSVKQTGVATRGMKGKYHAQTITPVICETLH